jgi:hypothetical protein
MTSRTTLLTSFASFAILGSLAFVTPASALSLKDCSVKYKAAQAAGTLNGMKWNDFRAAQCGADATATTDTAAPAATTATKPAAAPATTATKPAAAPATTTTTKPAAKSMAAAKPADAEPDPAVVPAQEPAKPTVTAPAGVAFPKAISAKYATETPAKGRFHTCVDAYHQNKDANTLGGLKWIEKGGGFYSLCNAKLKS